MDAGSLAGQRVEGAFELAQVNIARLLEPLDAPRLADFVAALDPVNAVADAADGFLWRLQTEEGNATSVLAFRWDSHGSAGVIVNLSVWRDVASLRAFVYGDAHRAVLRRRREWFHPVREAVTALWWVPTGHRPTVHEAEAAVRSLRDLGPTAAVFGLGDDVPPPGLGGSLPAQREG